MLWPSYAAAPVTTFVSPEEYQHPQGFVPLALPLTGHLPVPIPHLYPPYSSFYTGSPCMIVQQSPLVEDYRPRWSRHKGFRKNSSIDSSENQESIPSLRVPVSSLPSPQDVSGIPIQDEVCPFHQLSSTWLASSFFNNFGPLYTDSLLD